MATHSTESQWPPAPPTGDDCQIKVALESCRHETELVNCLDTRREVVSFWRKRFFTDRWLQQDAIRFWYHRNWIFPRDPEFATPAGIGGTKQ
jgi:hypothetical protein